MPKGGWSGNKNRRIGGMVTKAIAGGTAAWSTGGPTFPASTMSAVATSASFNFGPKLYCKKHGEVKYGREYILTSNDGNKSYKFCNDCIIETLMNNELNTVPNHIPHEQQDKYIEEILKQNEK